MRRIFFVFLAISVVLCLFLVGFGLFAGNLLSNQIEQGLRGLQETATSSVQMSQATAVPSVPTAAPILIPSGPTLSTSGERLPTTAPLYTSTPFILRGTLPPAGTVTVIVGATLTAMAQSEAISESMSIYRTESAKGKTELAKYWDQRTATASAVAAAKK